MGKFYGLRWQNEVLVSDSLAFRKTNNCKRHVLLVQRCWWLKCLCDWMAMDKSWLIRNNNNRILYETLRQNRLYCTNVATKTQANLKFYGRRVGDSWDATRFTSNYTSETGRLLWSDSTYLLCWKLLRFTLTLYLRNEDISKVLVIFFPNK